MAEKSWQGGAVRYAAGFDLMKKLIVFDLDGTLATSKQAIDDDMGRLFVELLDIWPIAVISGGDWPQFERQLLGQLMPNDTFDRLFLLPTSGTKFYRFDRAWAQVYADIFTDDERPRVTNALAKAVTDSGLKDDSVWGEQIENRGSQITFSGLGQQAPPDAKAAWDADIQKRTRLKALLDLALPDFAVRIGGSTSIDITRPGVDKAYGIRKLAAISGFDLPEMLFVGDALYPGGNDSPVRDAGVATIAVNDISETKLVIETIIKLGS